MKFITCLVLFPYWALLEENEAAVEFCKSKRNCSSYPAAHYFAFDHHICIRLYRSNFLFLYYIVYSNMYSYVCVYLLDKKQVSVLLKWTVGEVV